MVIAVETKGKVISTGNLEIDKKMGGGIPRGSLILIEGQSDSGKSVLTQQMVWGSLHQDCKVSVLTTENTVKSLITQMQSLNLDVQDYCLLGRLKIYPVKAMKARDGAENAMTALLHAVLLQREHDFVVIDSLTSFITHAPLEQVIGFFEECKSYCNRGMTIAIVAHSYAFGESLLARISSMCDTHLRLSLENMGQKLLKILQVAKIRGAQKDTGNIVGFDIEAGWGMRIIPLSKARA